MYIPVLAIITIIIILLLLWWLIMSVTTLLGCAPFCGSKPLRAPHIGTFVFPLRRRCSRLVTGAVLAMLAGIHRSVLVGIVCGAPALFAISTFRERLAVVAEPYSRP